MSIVCQKCRRLVRASNIYEKEGDYFCLKCQKTYKLPSSYFKRGDIEVPLLSENTELKVYKSEDELLIELPMNVLTLEFLVSTAMIAFMAFFIISFLQESESNTIPISIFIFAIIFLINLLRSMAKPSILVKEGSIIFYKQFVFFKIKKEEKFKDVQRIREVEIELEADSIVQVPSKFIEVFFKDRDSWEFGHNLSHKDRQYVIAELKLAHVYNNAMA